MKNLNPQGVVILRNKSTQRVTKATFLDEIVDKLERPHISDITKKRNHVT